MVESGVTTLLFDGDCGFCTACAATLRVFDRRRRIRLVPFQTPGACEGLGLPLEPCQEAAWAAAEGERPVRGAEAILLGLASATGLTRLRRIYGYRLVRRAADSVYSWVSDHRGKFPGVRPYCQAHPEACGRPEVGAPTARLSGRS